MLGDKIATEAKEWVGTKWQHQAALKGVAADCVGLLRGVYTQVTGKPVEISLDYHRLPLPGRESQLQDELKKYAFEVELTDMQPGDVLLFSFLDRSSNHVGIYVGEGRFVHAWADVGRVVETQFTPAWERSVKAVYRIREDK